MSRTHFSLAPWLVFMERGLLRIAMVVLALILMIAGLAMGVSMVMLPVGLVIGFVGVALLVWGLLGDLPVD